MPKCILIPHWQTNAGNQRDSDPEDRSHRAYQPVPVVYETNQPNTERGAPRPEKKQAGKLKSALKGSTVQKSKATQQAIDHQGIGTLIFLKFTYVDLYLAATQSRNELRSDERPSDPARVTPTRLPRPRDGDIQTDGERNQMFTLDAY